jgi:hypothetical protein
VQTCLVRCEYEHAEQLLRAYAAICPTTVDEVRDYFEVRDKELCATALALLRKILDRHGNDEKPKG